MYITTIEAKLPPAYNGWAGGLWNEFKLLRPPSSCEAKSSDFVPVESYLSQGQIDTSGEL